MFLIQSSTTTTFYNTLTCTSSTVAVSCASGYYLTSNACSVCGTGAATCTSLTAATTCLAGYYFTSVF